MKSVIYGAMVGMGLIAAVSPASATILTFQTPLTAGGEAVGNWDKYYNSTAPLDKYGDNVDNGAATTFSDPEGAYTFNYSRGAEGWTPNVTVNYSAEAGTGAGPDGIGRVVDPSNPWASEVAWLDSDTNSPNLPRKFWFTFTPDPGYEVRVDSYDIVNYSFANAGQEITIFQNTVGGTQMVNTRPASPVATSGPGASTHYDLLAGVDPSTNLPDPSEFYAGPVILQIDLRTASPAGNYWTLAVDNLTFEQRLIPEPASLGLLTIAALALGRRRK